VNAAERRAARIKKMIRKILAGRTLPVGLQIELKRAEDYCSLKKANKHVMELLQYCITLFRCEVVVEVGSPGLILTDLRCTVRNMLFNLSKLGKEEIVLFHGGLASPLSREYKAIEYALEAYHGRIWLEARNLVAAKSGLVIFKNGLKLKFGECDPWL